MLTSIPVRGTVSRRLQSTKDSRRKCYSGTLWDTAAQSPEIRIPLLSQWCPIRGVPSLNSLLINIPSVFAAGFTKAQLRDSVEFVSMWP